MEKRVAAITALIAFAMCLSIGAFEARNSFATTVSRALLAMLGTYVVGYFVGMMAERMMREHSDGLEKKATHGEGTSPDGR